MSRLGAVVLAAALALGACGGVRGRPLDTRGLVAELGLDGAAQALRVRIAADPTDVAARRALAALEDRRGRPGAVLAELSAVLDLGGPIGARLSGGERARLAALLRERARGRVARGAPDALADLDRARAIDDGDDAALRAEAEVALAIAELRHTDPERRAAGAARLGRVADRAPLAEAPIFRTIAKPDAAGVDELGDAGRWLWERGARRVALALLDAWERRGGRLRGGAQLAATLDAWLGARAWWRGPAGRPDLSTLDRAIEAGASPCHFATEPGEHGCRATAVLGGEARERALLARARARGWRTRDPDEAAAWVAIAAAAWRRGEIASWLGEVDARVELDELRMADVPAWARSPLLRAAGRGDDAAAALARVDLADAPAAAKEVVAIETAIRDDDPAALAAPRATAALDEGAVLAAAIGEGDAAGLADIVRAYRRDPAAAERVAGDVVARHVDVATAAAPVAELFLVLGDPARARAWYERAVEASPGDVALRAGLVRALAAAGDGAAARLHLTTVAAGSGDPERALLDGARALADAGLFVDALGPAKQALELAPPGDQHDVLAFLIEVATRLDRAAQVRAFTAALDAQRAAPATSTLRARALAGDADALARARAADPADADLALAAAAAEPDDARAAQLLSRAAAWNPADVRLRVALLARDPSATTDLAALASDPALARATRLTAARAVRRTKRK